MMPIVVGVHGMVSKGLEKRLTKLEIRGRIETIEITAFFAWTRTFRRVLKICGYLLSLRLLRKIISWCLCEKKKLVRSETIIIIMTFKQIKDLHHKTRRTKQEKKLNFARDLNKDTKLKIDSDSSHRGSSCNNTKESIQESGKCENTRKYQTVPITARSIGIPRRVLQR